MSQDLQAKWISSYTSLGALWIHDRNPKRPHALLTAGNHSSGFFNSRLVIADEELLREAAVDLIRLFIEAGGDTEKVDRVVGPQTGATKLAEFVATEITARRDRECLWASPAKEGDGSEGNPKKMVFNDSDRSVKAGEVVLIVEDVVTTAGSVKLTAQAIFEKGGVLMDHALILVNRSGEKIVGGVNTMQMVALIDHPMPSWDPADCPLCKDSSEPLRPKDNWAALNADY